MRVPVIDFERFLQLNRARDDNDGMQRTTVVKMDIEGSEFTVLPQLTTGTTLCSAVDSLSVEFHASYAPIAYMKNGAITTLDTVAEAEAAEAEIRRAISHEIAIFPKGAQAGSCRLKKLLNLDDESYVDDRNPIQLHDPTPT